MRRIYFMSFVVFFVSVESINAQISTNKMDGGSVVTKLDTGLKVNENSTLSRQWIILNEVNCPVQLGNVGIQALYADSQYNFIPVGNISLTVPIVAFEIVHVLYNVFGEYITTLSNTKISDMNGNISLEKYRLWYANENHISEYFICVSYVQNVRTSKGIIWHCNFKDMKEHLEKEQIKFEEEYALKNVRKGIIMHHPENRNYNDHHLQATVEHLDEDFTKRFSPTY
jgi:hypothetical protein